MPLRSPPKHIQGALDRHFPGMKLQWNPRIGYWVITDDLFIHGQVDWTACYKPPGGLVGVEPYEHTRRALIWVLGDTRTGERWEPCRDLILNALHRAWNGGNVLAKHEFIDGIEAGEARAEAREVAEKRERARDVASDTFDRVVRGKGVFSRSGATTAKSVQRDIDKARREAELETSEADAVADQMIRRGMVSHGGVTKFGG